MTPSTAGLILVLGLLAVWYFELLVPLGAGTHIRIRGGALHVVRGIVRSHVQSALTDILRQAGVSNGFICINGQRRILFSRNIPLNIRQQLRNVLANQ